MREQSSVMVTKLKPFSYIICIIVELFLIYRNGLHAFKRKQHHVYCLLCGMFGLLFWWCGMFGLLFWWCGMLGLLFWWCGMFGLLFWWCGMFGLLFWWCGMLEFSLFSIYNTPLINVNQMGEFESRWWQGVFDTTLCDKVSDLRQVGGFLHQ
jgi:hypothetical protein